jgi:hypothetical protein
MAKAQTLEHLLCECEATTEVCKQLKVPGAVEFMRIYLLQLTARELFVLTREIMNVLESGR